jgi:hypothetical protein
MYPAIPTLDNYLQPCTSLRDELGLHFQKSTSPQKVKAFEMEEVFTMLKEKQVFRVSGEEAFATTKTGEVCGIYNRIDKGRLTALGFAFGYTTDEHLLLFEKILSLDKIKREVKVSDPDIQFIVRHGKEYSYLFLLNYHNQKKTFSVDRKRHTLAPLSYKVVRMDRKRP